MICKKLHFILSFRSKCIFQAAVTSILLYDALLGHYLNV